MSFRKEEITQRSSEVQDPVLVSFTLSCSFSPEWLWNPEQFQPQDLRILRNKSWYWWKSKKAVLGVRNLSRMGAPDPAKNCFACSSESSATRRHRGPGRHWADSRSCAISGSGQSCTRRSRSWSCWCWSSSWVSCRRSCRSGFSSIVQRVARKPWLCWRIWRGNSMIPGSRWEQGDVIHCGERNVQTGACGIIIRMGREFISTEP